MLRYIFAVCQQISCILSETYKITMAASSTLARFTLRTSTLRSVAFRRSACSIWTLSTAAQKLQTFQQQSSLVRGPVII